MYALYAFARIVDDIGDKELNPSAMMPGKTNDNGASNGDDTECRELQRRARDEQLRTIEIELSEALQVCVPTVQPPNCPSRPRTSPPQRLKESEDNRHNLAPLWPAIAHVAESFAIPPQLLFDIVEGVRMDLDPKQPADWEELKRYCYHVASAVGLACVYIWKSDSQRDVGLPRQSAIDCGIAFQLTNILRDVAEDARAGRIYIPLSEMESYGVDPQRWLAGEPTGNWAALIDQMAMEAQKYYNNGWPTIAGLTPASQRMFSLMWRSYHQLLEQVVANKQTLWSESKVRLSTTTKLNLLTSHLVPQWFRRLPTP